MLDRKVLEKVIEKFNIEGVLENIEVNDTGNINNTFVATFINNSEKKRYLIQKINTSVFTEPYKLMKNIEGVTSYLKDQMKKENDTEHQVLEVIKTKDGKSLCYLEDDGERDYYRIYEYIENAITYNTSKDYSIVYNTGKAFGNFQRLLRDYPMNKLNESIKDFHSTDKRYNKLLEDIKIDSEARVMEVAKEIVFILMREDEYSKITSRLGEVIPYRVTHNDTKVNNVMMNKKTNDFLAVIDLDTVMPGSMLFDYGDGIRSTCASAFEDETDLSKVHMDLNLFEAYTSGYLSEMASYLTEEEINLMAESIKIITLELAIRFLNDYINGDTYFKINYPNHNLDRARNQLALVVDIESKLDYMNEFIHECINKNKSKAKSRILTK